MKHLSVVLHAHSNWSYDGKWELKSIARLYGSLGIDVVMMTEHDTGFDPAQFESYRASCATASTSKCRLVPGIEYSSPDNSIHILTWGLKNFLAEHRPVLETLSAISEAGGVAIFAHPIRREAWKKFDPAWVRYLHGIELWNRKSDGLAPGKRAEELISKTGLPPTVGQDFHDLKHLWPLTMAIRGDRRNLEASLVASLRAGEAVPRALWRPIVVDGIIQRVPHEQIERTRRALRDAIRNKQ